MSAQLIPWHVGRISASAASGKCCPPAPAPRSAPLHRATCGKPACAGRLEQRPQFRGAPRARRAARKRASAARPRCTGANLRPGSRTRRRPPAAAATSASSSPLQRIGSRSSKRRAQRPLVHFGRQEQLIDGRGDGERDAARVPARDGARCSANPSMRARALDARAPGARSARHRRAHRPHRARRPWMQRIDCRPSGAGNPRTAVRRGLFSRRSPAPSEPALVANQAFEIEFGGDAASALEVSHAARDAVAVAARPSRAVWRAACRGGSGRWL